MVLPHITVKVAKDVREFLAQMETLLREEGDLVVKAHLENRTEFEPFSLGFSKGDAGSSESVGIFLAWMDEDPRIRIEVLDEWKESFPNYKEFVGKARELFEVRLKAYNRRFGSRYRLSIPSHEKCLPRLTPSLQKQFDQFIGLANMRCLHPYDWNRFYQFIARSHRHQPQLDPEDVGFLLRKSGMSDEMSKELSDVFYRCRDFHIATRPRSRMW